METRLFYSFDYVVGSPLSFKNKRKVTVFFIYKEEYLFHLPLLIKKVKNHEDEKYYLNEAKKIVSKMIQDGSLKKYAEKCVKAKKKKKFLSVAIAATIVGACAIAGVAIGIYEACKPPVTTYKVSCKIDGVTLSDTKAKVGEDYHATLKVNTDKVDELYALPSTLTKVTSGGKKVKDYTYISHDLTADLIIPKESVKGNIAITASLEKLTSLRLTAQEDNSSIGYFIEGSLPNIHIQTSIDGEAWEDWDGSAITLNKDEFRYIQNTLNTLSTDYNNYLSFEMTGKIAASGNVNSMINNNELSNDCFRQLFKDCGCLTRAPALPSISLRGADNCYCGMFQNCTSLIFAPALISVDISSFCYQRMFQGCTSLISAPELPSKTIANRCYIDMFYGCTSLISAPELPATTLQDQCYYEMFQGCTSLTSAPDLPAKTLTYTCYQNMFYGCTSLKVAPSMPAETQSTYCCKNMFRGCTSLTTAPTLYFNVLASSACDYMFYDCTSLKVNENGTGTKIITCKAALGIPYPYDYMFTNTGGDFTGTPTSGNTYYWY